MSRFAWRRGLANGEGASFERGRAGYGALACAGVAAVAVAVGIATLDHDALDDATGGIALTDAQPVPELPRTPVDVADDVISRVEAARPPAEPSGEETSLAGRRDVSSHIGRSLDPEAEDGGGSDDPPSHIGEHLDPDDAYGSGGTGEVSHIGEYLDPLANE